MGMGTRLNESRGADQQRGGNCSSLPILTTKSFNMPQASHFNIYIRNTETGKGFDEHHVKTIDKQTECYIESRNGVKFEIFIEINAATQPAGFRNLAYACRVYVDGRRVKTPIMGNIERKRVGHVTVSGMLLPPTELAPFVFGQTVFTGIIELKPLFTSCRTWRYGQSNTLKTWTY